MEGTLLFTTLGQWRVWVILSLLVRGAVGCAMSINAMLLPSGIQMSLGMPFLVALDRKRLVCRRVRVATFVLDELVRVGLAANVRVVALSLVRLLPCTFEVAALELADDELARPGDVDLLSVKIQ